jgi:hypothetical protein
MPVLVLNFQSMLRKMDRLLLLVNDEKPLFIFGSETWLYPAVDDTEIELPGYNVVRRDRPTSPHGGVLIYCVNTVSITDVVRFETCEAIAIKCVLSGRVVIAISLYRPPTSPPGYLDEVFEFIGANRNAVLFLGGDFNFANVTWNEGLPSQVGPSTAASRRFIEAVQDNSLFQTVGNPTRGSSILDLFFTNHEDIVDCGRVLCQFSDHHAVAIDVRVVLPPTSRATSFVSDFRKGDLDGFRNYLKTEWAAFNSLDTLGEQPSIDVMWTCFKQILLEGERRFVPKRRTLRVAGKPWFTFGLKRLLNKKRRFYAAAKNSPRGSPAWIAYDSLDLDIKRKLSLAKSQYFSIILPELLNSNPTAFWRYANPRASPTCSADFSQPAEQVANLFATHFTEVFQQNDLLPLEDCADTPPQRMNAIYFSFEGTLNLVRSLHPPPQ